MRRKFSISFAQRPLRLHRRSHRALFAHSAKFPLPANTDPQKVYLRTKNSRLRAFLFIGCCLLLASCFDKGDCLFTNTDVVKVNLMDLDTPSISHTVTFDSVFIPGSVYFDNAQGTVSTLYVAVDPRKTQTEYVFRQLNRSDTLVLSYTNQTIVLSPDCGAYQYQDNLDVVYSTFDSVHIINQRLLTSVAVNVQIFF